MIIASNNDTICAPATPNRSSALGIVRISGQEAISIADKLFVDTKNQKKVLAKQKSSIAKHGFVIDANGEKLDEVICTIFKAPNTFTGEDLVEITHHGSPYIQQQIIKS
ncbi:MAG: tRNA uridine-5-carboxymethylaminomethyl(34) synthesis GTPase MnmE, partial [Bacteroidales bacterium]|nr:tRNA uridine-5-carboxymethylaminomethyl(34) synthesis GTPase MnmE [Bacteroidales bacterium]